MTNLYQVKISFGLNIFMTDVIAITKEEAIFTAREKCKNHDHCQWYNEVEQYKITCELIIENYDPNKNYS